VKNLMMVVLTVLLTVVTVDAQFVTFSPSFSLSGETELGDGLVVRGGTRYNSCENSASQPYGGLTVFGQFGLWFMTSNGVWIDIEGCNDHWNSPKGVYQMIMVGLEWQPKKGNINKLLFPRNYVNGKATSGMDFKFRPTFSVHGQKGGLVLRAGFHVNLSKH